MRKLLAIFIVMSCNSVHAQNTGKAIPSFQGSFELPSPLKNDAFKGVMSGLSNINLGIQFPIFRGVFIGVGGKHQYYNVNDLAIPEKINGDLQMLAPVLKLGVDMPMSDKSHAELSIAASYNFIRAKSQTCLDNSGFDTHTTTGIGVEPKLVIYMASTDKLRFGIILSYSIIMDEFGADDFCLTRFSGYADSASKGSYQIFSVGFGFSASLVKEKRTG